jgi:ankyrin repeat protein
MPSKLTHSDLLHLGKLLKQPLNQSELSRGFSAKLTQALLTGDDKKLFARLKFIESYNKDFKKLKDDIDNAQNLVKSGLAGNLDESARNKIMQLIEIPEFFEEINISWRHADLLTKYKNQEEAEFLAPFASPISLNENDVMTVVFEKSYAFDEEELLAYLTDLEEQFEQTDVTAPVVFAAMGHAVSAKYDKDNKKWTFVDTDDFTRYADSPAYSISCKKEELVGRLFQSFDVGPEPSPYIILTTTVVANQSESSELQAAFAEFDQRYPITQELVDKRDDQDLNLLSLACLNNEVEVVEDLLLLDDIRVNQADENGNTPLILACQEGHLKVVQALLTHPDTQINQACNTGKTPLYWACQNGNLTVVRELLNHPDIQVNTATYNPMFDACKSGNHELVQELLKHNKINVNQEYSIRLTPSFSIGMTPFQYACQEGYTEIVKSFINSNRLGNFNQPDAKGYTPLHYACMNGQTEVVKLLVNSSKLQNINQKNADGLTPLHYACKGGHTQVVEALLNSKQLKNLNIESNFGKTPLMQACDSTHTEKRLIQSLLQHGASITHKNKGQQTALDYAVLINNKAAMEAIIEQAAAQKINIKTIVSKSNYPKIQKLIVAQEREKRFHKQLDQADKLIAAGAQLLEITAQTSSMTLKQKKEYLLQITDYLGKIKASHMFDAADKNYLPEFAPKADMIKIQKDVLKTIKLSMEKELSVDSSIQQKMRKTTKAQREKEETPEKPSRRTGFTH